MRNFGTKERDGVPLEHRSALQAPPNVIEPTVGYIPSMSLPINIPPISVDPKEMGQTWHLCTRPMDRPSDSDSDSDSGAVALGTPAGSTGARLLILDGCLHHQRDA